MYNNIISVCMSERALGRIHPLPVGKAQEQVLEYLPYFQGLMLEISFTFQIQGWQVWYSCTLN